MPEEQPKEVEKNIYDVLHRIVGIVGTIVFIPVIVIIILALGYLLIILGLINEISPSAASTIQSTMMEVWRALLPIANKAISVLSPILVLLILAGIVRWIAPPEKLNLANITENLPAFLAVFIVATICLLPLLGMEIPNVLSNIALVVVGYYFGKLKIGTSRT
ncbi:hypothetical protein [Aliarcobacter butzleri]|uniref:hypothetical protein n=1 Tax=Aliarcobacter butzleri TaxID=28197 RepID=UPI00263D0E88|nr:hypothetical protein [Aliarcobacter butzleri]MDN5059123.1 hypothetical protein [Aliarcobacter butzleri]